MDEIRPWRVLGRLKLHQMNDAELNHYIEYAWWMKQLGISTPARNAYNRRFEAAKRHREERERINSGRCEF